MTTGIKSYIIPYRKRGTWNHYFIDLLPVFQTILPEEKGKYKHDVVPLNIAEARVKRFMARLKAYIIEQTEDDNEDFDWSDWDTYRG